MMDVVGARGGGVAVAGHKRHLLHRNLAAEVSWSNGPKTSEVATSVAMVGTAVGRSKHDEASSSRYMDRPAFLR